MSDFAETAFSPAGGQAASGRLAHMVRHFTPNWFTATMGTGVLALTLNQFPWAFPGLHQVAMGLWLCNIVLFTTFTGLYSAHWLFHVDNARRIFDHPVASMFFGAIPMGLVTIINGFLAFGVPLWGETAVRIAEALWWCDAAMSLGCGLLVPYLMIIRQSHSLDRMTAVWLLPIVAAEVAAASGGLLAAHLAPADAFVIVALSYGLWALSVPLALSVLVILVLRLILHKLPERAMAVSGWLALGPIGTGALGLVVLGSDAPRAFAAAGLSGAGETAFGLGLIGGLILWGYGVWWLLLAVMTTLHYVRHGLPFNLGWWGFTFPLGVYTLATLALAKVTGLTFLTVIGGCLVLCLAALWGVVAVHTLRGAWRGDLFQAPYLAEAGTGPAA